MLLKLLQHKCIFNSQKPFVTGLLYKVFYIILNKCGEEK